MKAQKLTGQKEEKWRHFLAKRKISAVLVVLIVLGAGIGVYAWSLGCNDGEEEIRKAGGTVRHYHGGPNVFIDLSEGRQVGAALAHLQCFPGVVDLDLSGSDISDQSLAYIQNFQELESVNISNTNVGGIGLSLMKNLPSLMLLNLHNTEVDDESLVYLRQFSVLHIIDLSNTNVTDKGLDSLRLPSVSSIDVRGTHVTEEAAHKLETALRESIEVTAGQRKRVGSRK